MVKWNPKTKNYEKYDPPKDGFYPLYTLNMDLSCNCVSCGKELKYGDGFSSRFIHSEGFGLAFSVCPECHDQELAIEAIYSEGGQK